MKFGIVPINLREFIDPNVVLPFVQRAEALGYESVWTAEHAIIGQDSLAVYEDLGVQRLLVNMHALRAGSVTAAMEHFANEVVAKHA